MKIRCCNFLIERESFEIFSDSIGKIRKTAHRGVFCEIPKMLSKHGNKSLNLFCKLMLEEENDIARFNFADKSVSYPKSVQMRSTLLEFLKKDLSYRSKGKALYSLASQRNLEDYSLVLEYSNQKDGHQHIGNKKNYK